MFDKEIKCKEGIVLKIFHKDYGFLFKGDTQISEEIFRCGGMFSGFHEGYVNLIKYEVQPDGFDYGTHVIINTSGKIVLAVDNMLYYPQHVTGNVGAIQDKYFNLITGEFIVEGYHAVISPKSVFVAEKCHNLEHTNKMYKIDKITCKLETLE